MGKKYYVFLMSVLVVVLTYFSCTSSKIFDSIDGDRELRSANTSAATGVTPTPVITPVSTPDGTSVEVTTSPTPTSTPTMTPAITPVVPVITGLSATMFDRTGDIVISWDAVAEAGVTYRVYRYSSVLDMSADAVFNTTLNYCYDMTAVADTLYVYRAVCVNGTYEGALSEYVYGMFSTDVDIYEPNDVRSTLVDQEVSTLFPAGVRPLMYSVPDGDDVICDTDWYKYSGGCYQIRVSVTVDSPDLNDGDVKFQFYYDGAYYYDVPQPVVVGSGALNEFYFDAYSEADFAVNHGEVYFKVYVDGGVVADDKVIVAGYDVVLSDEF